MLSVFIRGSRTAVLIRALVTVAAIALADWRIEDNVPLGFLYLFPMVLAGSVLNRWQIGMAATGCTALTEIFDSFNWLAPAAIPRDILTFSAFFGMGLFVYETGRSRQLALWHLQEIEREARARAEVEEQLEVLVESSPAAVFTSTAYGHVLLANEAAHRLFGVAPGALQGRSIHEYLPSLANVPLPGPHHTPLRTAMQCRGHRENGEVFLADLWFSTYLTSAGPRLAAMVVDTSEDFRNREEISLNQLLAGSRILVAAVSHEIRNVCGAIAMAHANLARTGQLNGSQDFEALGSLILALEKIASMDLRQTVDQVASIYPGPLLEELRIIVETSLEEQDIQLRWQVSPGLPQVWADRQSLMQVFLNLTRNSTHAMLRRPVRQLTISTEVSAGKVAIRFRDTGCGVAEPDRLFRPFQRQAQATGLGLYLSRAFTRSFRGDLRFEPEEDGCSFIVELSRVVMEKKQAIGAVMAEKGLPVS